MATDPETPPADALPPLPGPAEPTLPDLDEGAPEPVDQLDFLETARADDDELAFALSEHEPESTPLGLLTSVPRFVHAEDLDDLADFATQEELPCLPWQLDVHLLEQGRTVRAQLDPTLARSILEQPGASAHSLAVTLRIRMLDVPLTLPVVDGPVERLRVGRDVLAGRILIRVD